MSDHAPAILFLLPFLTAISLPMVGLKRREWCRPMALVAVFAMSPVALANLLVVLNHGEIRYAFSGWRLRLALNGSPTAWQASSWCSSVSWRCSL